MNHCSETFFTEVIGNRVKDHYARNIYIEVFLKKAVLSVTSKTLQLNISKFFRNYPKKVRCRSLLPNIFLIIFYFWLQCVKQEFTLFVSLFLQKIRWPVLVSYKLGTLQLISFLLYNNSFYKNHKAENRPNIKNFVRITPGSRSRYL